MQENEARRIERKCPNCHADAEAWVGKDGMTKTKCEKCGSVSVSKRMSRRHIQIDVYKPTEQESTIEKTANKK